MEILGPTKPAPSKPRSHLQVAIIFAAYDFLDASLRNTVTLAERLLRVPPSGVNGLYLQRLRVCERCTIVRLSATGMLSQVVPVSVHVASLSDHIVNVVLERSQKQMRGVDADRIIASVEHPQMRRVDSAMEFERQPMRRNFSERFGDAECSVLAGLFFHNAASPWPAFINASLVDITVKGFRLMGGEFWNCSKLSFSHLASLIGDLVRGGVRFNALHLVTY